MDREMKALLAIIFLVSLPLLSGQAQENKYLWAHGDTVNTITGHIAPPDSFTRKEIPPLSFGDWLRHLPLKPDGTPVVLFNRLVKRNQNAHQNVIDIDVGAKNWQQTGNSVIRLRGEYLFSRGFYDSISFWLTTGDTATFRNWISGFRPVMDKNELKWSNQGIIDSSHASFREYLDSLYTHAGSMSLLRDSNPVDSVTDLRVGDFFLKSGNPGHASIVVDIAENVNSGRRLFLLAQSHMPAQDIYVLKNLADSTISPWYRLDFGDSLRTPEWVYAKSELHRFK